MRDREYSAYLLLNAPGFGAKSIFYIYESLRKAGLKINDLFEQSITQLSNLFPEIGQGRFSKASVTSLLNLDDDKRYSSYQKLKKENVHLIGLDDERYPRLLISRLGENTPPVLFCKGYLPLLNSDSISIVGSRDVSEFGIKITKRIANRLAGSGYNVSSGFAKGVDTSAHIGALENHGTTTMVLSYGFNYLSVKKEIKEFDWERNTLFISQFMPYEKFSGQNAMTRNKLVCALSQAVIVISSGPERDSSGKMSGTFDAGLTALKYKIPLFVLNPSLLNPNPPQGNIDLIKLGGISLSNGDELVQSLGAITTEHITAFEPAKTGHPELSIKSPQTNLQPQRANTEDIKGKILSVFNGKPLSINDIIEQAHLNWTTTKLSSYLKKVDEIELVKKGRSNFYKRKASQQQTQLFV